jgi:hypothetical protein
MLDSYETFGKVNIFDCNTEGFRDSAAKVKKQPDEKSVPITRGCFLNFFDIPNF